MKNIIPWDTIPFHQKKMVEISSFLILTSVLAIFVQIIFYFIQFIPFIGGLIGELVPLGRFFLFFFIGSQWATHLKGYNFKPWAIKLFVPVLTLLVGLIFLSNTVIEYNHLPWRIHKQKNISYKEASNSLTTYLKKETGSSGFVAYLKYKGKQPLSFSAKHLGISESDGEGMESLGDLIAWIINLILHLIPILFYKLTFNVFLWNLGGGYISLVYWFLFNCIIAHIAFRSESD